MTLPVGSRKEHERLDPLPCPQVRRRNTATGKPFLHVHQFVRADFEGEVRVFCARFDKGAPRRADPDSRAGDLEQCEGGLLHDQLAP